MTADADDAGLVELTDRLREPFFEYAPGFGFALINEIARPDMCKAADLLEAQRREIVELRRERDAWKNVCSRAGICMSCALGSPEPFGCPDCLNTGWSEGAPQDVYEAKSALAEALKVMDLVRDICTFDVTMGGSIYTGTNASACMRAYKAASAFATKHGGRDG